MSAAEAVDVVVVGGANTDYLVLGPKLPEPGETVQGDLFQEGPGGKGANAAVAAARLGARVALVARVGTDGRGDDLVDHLRTEGVDTRYVARDPAAPTGVALVLVARGGKKEIMTAPGANARLSINDVREAAATIALARVLLAQFEAPLECVIEAARIAREAGAEVVLDPAPPLPPDTPVPDELLRMVSVIRSNSGEAEALAGVRVVDRDSARRAIRRLFERGVRAGLVEAGDEGNLLIWRDESGEPGKPGEGQAVDRELWLPRLPVDSVDSTGAGDAFAGALAAMIAEGLPLDEAAIFANATAALSTTSLGAQAGLPRREEVLAFVAGLTAGGTPLYPEAPSPGGGELT